MKNTILYSAALLLAIVSCTKAEFEPSTKIEPVPASSGNVVIRAGVPSEDTKAIHGTGTEDGTSFAWEAGVDDINLLWLHDESSFVCLNGPARFVNNADGDQACFEAAQTLDEPIAVGDTLYAIYPYKTSTNYNWYDSDKGEDVACFRTSFGSTMQVGDNSTAHLDNLDIMISKPVVVTAGMEQPDGSFDIPMEFAHLFSKIRVNVVNATSAPFEVKSLVYHSTKTDDLLSGVIYMNMRTREVLAENREYGDCAPSSNAILQTSGITVPAGGSATLWMWMMPLDFTSGNADGRSANIYLNTSAGVFHVDGVNFAQAFAAGKTYRHKFTATAEKKLEGYTLVPDANFAKALLAATYDYDLGVTMKMYDYELNEVDFSGFDPCWSDDEMDAKFAGGLFVKNSEVAGIEELEIQTQNAVSTEGLQAFTSLKYLGMSLSLDMSPVLAVRSLDISALTELEEFVLSNSQVEFFDVSKNTKLKAMSIEFSESLASIDGLRNHPAMEKLDLNTVGVNVGGFSADLSGCAKLKNVAIECDVKTLDLTGLSLDRLSLGTNVYDGVSMSGLTVADLELTNAPMLSVVPQGVKKLTVSPACGSNSIASQIGSFEELDTLVVNSWGDFGFNLEFGEANSTVKVAEISLSEGLDASEQGGTVVGLEKLTGVDSLVFHATRENRGEAAPMVADFSGMTQCRHFEVAMGENFAFAGYKLPESDVLETALVRFNDAEYPDLTIGGLPALKNLDVLVYCNSDVEHVMTFGDLPALESLSFNAENACAIPVFSSSYLKLSSVAMYGKYIEYFPIYPNQEMNLQYSTDAWVAYTAGRFPALRDLSFASSGNVCVSGINYVDLRPYSALERFYCFWKYYDSVQGAVERSQESIWITESQAAYASSKPDAYRVSWYANWANSGTVSITTPRTSKGSYYYGGYAKVCPDLD